MKDSKLIPEDNNSTESSFQINEENNKEDNVSPQKAANDGDTIKKKKPDFEVEKLETNTKSIFQRIINEGFDGISTNPNYKMLTLLIILLINLSLFFVIGNIGKAFLRNAGIMG